jgi:dipeptidyl aminopeptidase/acylaminoacyl peptidase
MSGEVRDTTNRRERQGADTRLESWKEIAAYLRRDVTTVRRWEKREGLPVHRHSHERRDSVYAYGVELDEWLRERAVSREQVAVRHRLGPGAPLAWIAAGCCLLTVVVSTSWLVLRWRVAPLVADRIQSTLPPPEGAALGSISVSPDGRRLAFTASSPGGSSVLWMRDLSAAAASPLAGTEGAAFPFWSPDSRSLGFFAQGKLKTIPAEGGAPHIVCDAPAGRGGSWSASGSILFAPGRDMPLFRVSAAGGTGVPVTSVDRPRERGHMWPIWLPDGRRFLFLADAVEAGQHGVYLASVDAAHRTRLLDEASNLAYTGDGLLLFARNRRLMAQPFDAERGELAGEPIVVAESVRETLDSDHLHDFSASAGVLAYRGMPSLETRLVWRDRSGRIVGPIASVPALYADPTLAADRGRVAVDIFDPEPSPRFGFALGDWTSDIWIFDVRSGARTRFTFDPSADFEPVWSPDAAHIAFSSNRRGSLDLYVQDTRGGEAALLLHTGAALRALSWSPDGRFVLYAALEPEGRFDVWMVAFDGDRTPVPLLRTEFSEHQASVSPDGRWLAYTSNESGRNEVYVRRFPSLAGKWQISSDGGGDARWRPDGRELFFIAENRTLNAVAVEGGEAFRPGAVTPLFDSGHQPRWAVARNHYDVSGDGQRFAMMMPLEGGPTPAITLVVNWAAALPRKTRR